MKLNEWNKKSIIKLNRDSYVKYEVDSLVWKQRKANLDQSCDQAIANLVYSSKSWIINQANLFVVNRFIVCLEPRRFVALMVAPFKLVYKCSCESRFEDFSVRHPNI